MTSGLIWVNVLRLVQLEFNQLDAVRIHEPDCRVPFDVAAGRICKRPCCCTSGAARRAEDCGPVDIIWRDLDGVGRSIAVILHHDRFTECQAAAKIYGDPLGWQRAAFQRPPAGIVAIRAAIHREVAVIAALHG